MVKYYPLLIPEFILILAGVLILFLPSKVRRISLPFAFGASFGSLLSSILVAAYIFSTNRVISLFDVIIIDKLGIIFKVIILFLSIIVISCSRRFNLPFPHVYYSLLLFSSLSLLLLVCTFEFVTIFIALELLGICFYILVAYLRNYYALEASLKYFLYGELASALFLFGLSLLCLSCGGLFSFSFLIAVYMKFLFGKVPFLAILGMLFILVALGFKVGYAPFHMWLPDTYQGAATPVVAYLATGSKIAGFILLLRILAPLFATSYYKKEEIIAFFALIFFILAILSMVIGNLGALHQLNIKRMLGYSSIGHVGYILVGWSVLFLPNSSEYYGILQSIFFYILVYSLAILLAFYVVGIVEVNRGVEVESSYLGILKENPLLAFGMLIALASLAGLPPTGGFFGKLQLISTALSANSWVLAISIVLFSIISVYYYFRVVKSMYLEEEVKAGPTNPEESASSPIRLYLEEKLVIALFIFLLFLLCLYPQIFPFYL
jgi:NADH-quinone oxidoreductase subunit N